MSQRYNGNTKRPKLKENQSAILKIYAKISNWSQVQERAAGVMYLYMRIQPKSCCTSFP